MLLECLLLNFFFTNKISREETLTVLNGEKQGNRWVPAHHWNTSLVCPGLSSPEASRHPTRRNQHRHLRRPWPISLKRRIVCRLPYKYIGKCHRVASGGPFCRRDGGANPIKRVGGRSAFRDKITPLTQFKMLQLNLNLLGSA